MKRKLAILLLACIYTSLINAQTSGTLSVTVTTSSAGGNYAPKNIVAIWIEDSSGNFVKTLLVYAATYKTYLNNWQASTLAVGSEYNTTDAITGATVNSHGTRTCSWNGTNYNKTAVADGNYVVKMELTDKNATGNCSSFTFAKGASTQKLTPSNVSSFSSITINWIPTVTGIEPNQTLSNTYLVYPNPGTGQFYVLGENIKKIQVADLSGKIILQSQTPTFNLSAYSQGMYMVTILTDKETVVQKIIKQ